ncbi:MULTISPECIES: hypothetical protein [Streptomyces]|uniref:SPOR domain-containing protein n=1 Tax=Streptomyces cacaoi TaxID=1898 RepID=A0A4Y3QYV6_STRCI|nr:MULTISPECIES: hypothetical protein [Streptomyces]NNG83882.1 hypothetical protein [Streptomyces cacaoi]GEB50149.1 hypothetical protein SCA03_27000 [Streptomyces cacaoi]
MALFKRKTVGEPGDWFFNVDTGQVEEGPQSPGKHRLGPYGSREEAERALESARERTQQWENDPRWRDGGGAAGGGASGGGPSGGGEERGE